MGYWGHIPEVEITNTPNVTETDPVREFEFIGYPSWYSWLFNWNNGINYSVIVGASSSMETNVHNILIMVAAAANSHLTKVQVQARYSGVAQDILFNTNSAYTFADINNFYGTGTTGRNLKLLQYAVNGQCVIELNFPGGARINPGNDLTIRGQCTGAQTCRAAQYRTWRPIP